MMGKTIGLEPTFSACRSMRHALRDDWQLGLLGLTLALAASTGSVSCDQRPKDQPIPVWPCRIVGTFPHRSDAFTQGLVIDEGFLYEGTGMYGRSSLCRLRLETGEVLQRCTLPEALWGEGVTVFGDRIFQLTWQDHVGFVYDKRTFNLIRKFTYPTEGWGLTNDGHQLIMSDGTASLYFLDPNTLEIQRTVEVRDDKGAVANLNELEFVAGRVYANIWQTDRIAVIRPEDGRITAWIDLSGLKAQQPPDADVLNGIACDPQTGRLFVTGKLWPTLYEIQVSRR